MIRVALAAALAILSFPAIAQHNHGAGHNEYQNWSSQKVSNCCSSQDCGEIGEGEIRETQSGTELRIDGAWCPVLPEHRLIRGRSPDWSVPHACVSQGAAYGNPCDKLLCFVPRGLF